MKSPDLDFKANGPSTRAYIKKEAAVKANIRTYEWMIKMTNNLFPISRTNLEVILDKISKQKEVRSANIVMSRSGDVKELDISKDLHFMVGKKSFLFGTYFKYFKVKFGDNDKKCVVTTNNSNDVLFLFDDVEEIKHIRKAIIDKYKEMLASRSK